MIRGDAGEWGYGEQGPTSPRTTADRTSGFVKAMSDAGLKPVIVYHNLSPAELYEKVRGEGVRGAGGMWATEQAAACGRGRRPMGPHARPATLLLHRAPLPRAAPQALQYEPSSHIVAGGALATISGAKTGRRCAAVCDAEAGTATPASREGRAVLPACPLAPAAHPLHCPGPLPCSPRDKRIAREPDSEADVWWGAGSHNYEMDER